LETIISILRAAGIPDAAAVRIFYSLFTYVFGFVIWEIPRQPGGRDGYVQRRREQLDDLPGAQFPALSELAPVLATSTTEEQFEFGLGLLLGGIEAVIG
jgi:hypothetical protein